MNDQNFDQKNQDRLNEVEELTKQGASILRRNSVQMLFNGYYYENLKPEQSFNDLNYSLLSIQNPIQSKVENSPNINHPQNVQENNEEDPIIPSSHNTYIFN